MRSWHLHNLVGHPAMAVCQIAADALLRFTSAKNPWPDRIDRLGNRIHDATQPLDAEPMREG